MKNERQLKVLRQALKKDPLIERLRETLKKRNMTAHAAARFIECSPRQIYRWLKYECPPGLLYRKMINLGIKRIERLP